MKNEQILIFANPTAGRGKGRAVASRLQRDLLNAGFAVQVILERPEKHSKRMLEAEPEVLIAVGGDGTLRAAVQFFFNDSFEGPAVLPIPMGTANLMGRHLGISWSHRRLGDAVLATIRRNKIVRLDAGRANGHLFLLMAGVGIDAQVVHLLDHMRRGPIALTSYILPAAMTFVGYNFPAISVSIDGKSVIQDSPAIAMIGNVKEYGAGFPILVDARPDDGLLDICILPCRDRRELIEILLYIASGSTLFANRLFIFEEKILK